MALLKQLIFCKVPFNNSYENVFDSKEKLITYLKSSNLNLVKHTIDFISLEKDRGFNANKKTVVTVNRNEVLGSFDFYNRFNYVVVTTGNKENVTEDKEYLYFIVGSRIDNSGEVVTFDLEYDEWHNNIDEFMEKNGNRQQFFDRMTYDGYEKTDNSYHYNGFIKDENMALTSYREYLSENVKDVNNNELNRKYRMLFMKVILDDSETIKFSETNKTEPIACRAFLPVRVGYIPFALVDGKDGISMDFNEFEIKAVGSTDYVKRNFVYTNWLKTDSNDYWKNLNSLAVKKEFTFYSPFTYVINLEQPSGRPIPRITSNVWYFEGIRSGTTLIDGPIIIGSNDSEYESYIRDLELDCSYNINVETLGEDKEKIQARCHYYPFEFFSVLRNREEKPLIPHLNNQKYKIRILLYSLSNSPLCKEYFSEFDETNFYPLKSNGTLPIVKDALIEYYRSNSAKDFSAYQNSLLSSTINSVFSGVRFATNPINVNRFMGTSQEIVNNILSHKHTSDYIDAKRKDAENSPNSVSMDINDANNDFSIQDDYIFFKNYIPSTIDAKSLADYFEKYGITYLNFDTIKQNYHKFDYYKIASPDFILTDLEALNTFKNIFSNGVRVWHLDYIYPINPDKKEAGKVFNEIISFDYTRANIPMSIIEGEKLL